MLALWKLLGEQLKVLSENTLIPISLAIVLAGGVVFVTTLYADVQKLKEEQTIDRIKQEKMADDIVLIKIRTEKILQRVSR